MFWNSPRDHGRGIAAAAYLSASALLVVAVAWGTVAVATRAVSMIEDAILDGSGRIAAASISEPSPIEAPSAVAHPATRIASTVTDRPPPQLTVAPRISTDSPDQDPAWDFHSGSSETYRTYCVRLCDGYFWPVSFSTTAERFEQDQNACASRCGAPARLFVHKMPGGGPANMVSLDGVPYSALKTAFLFRTKYVESCRCQPQPWEQQAADRHRLYAAVASAQKGDRKAAASVADLKARVETQAREAAADLETANAAANKTLAQLAQVARKSGIEAPPRVAARQNPKLASNPNRPRPFAAVNSGQDGIYMGLGAFQQGTTPPSRTGYRPASGPSRGWREKAFADH